MNRFVNVFMKEGPGMDKRKRKREKLKSAILETATGLFFEKGFDRVTMREIAEKAGVGAGTAYNYFGSKADLFLSVLSREFGPEEALSRDDGKPREREPLQEVRAFIDRRIAFFKTFDKALMQDLFGLASEGGRPHSCLLKRFIEGDEAFRNQLASRLEALAERGCFRRGFDPEAASRILHGVLSQYGTEYAFDKTMSFAAYRDFVMEAVDFVLGDKIIQGEETHV